MNAAAESKKPLSFWIFAGLNGLLLLLLLILVALLFGDTKTSHDYVMQNGHRLMIIAADGSIKGEMKKLKQEAEEIPESVDDAIPTAAAGLVGFDVGGEEEEAADVTTPMIGAPSTSSLVGSEAETLDAIPLEPRTNASLAPLNQKLVEKTTAGLLPRKGGGTSSFEEYKRPFESKSRRPIVALVITDLGAVKGQVEQAITLPLDVTLAFNPYAKHAPVWMESARNKGHESWLMLPAQPDDFPASDPGPDAILVDLKPEEELIPRLYNVLQKTHGYTGLLLPTNEATSDSLELMKWLNKELGGRGLGLIAAQTPSNSASTGFFKREDLTYASELVLDATLNEAAITAQLEILEQSARNKGYAMAVLRPYPISMQLIADWIAGLSQKGLVLAPASAVIERKQ